MKPEPPGVQSLPFSSPCGCRVTIIKWMCGHWHREIYFEGLFVSSETMKNAASRLPYFSIYSPSMCICSLLLFYGNERIRNEHERAEGRLRKFLLWPTMTSVCLPEGTETAHWGSVNIRWMSHYCTFKLTGCSRWLLCSTCLWSNWWAHSWLPPGPQTQGFQTELWPSRHFLQHITQIYIEIKVLNT